jgi:hypothetical protein
VRNAYATYLKQGNNFEKSMIIPHNIFGWHQLDIKHLWV